MKKHLITALSAAGIVALAAAQSEAREYKIGFIGPMSGGAAQLGQQMERGARLYMKLHPNELGGNTVKMIVRDSKRPGGPIAKAAAQELITREKVELITGLIFSPNAMSVAPLATKAKVPVVIMNAGTAFIPNMSPYMVRVSFTMWQAGFIMGQHAAGKLGCKTAVSGYTNYPPGKDSIAAFRKGFEASGGKIVDEIPMGSPAKVPDFTPFFQRTKSKKPNCLYVFVPAGNHASAVAKTYQSLAMRKAGIALVGPGDITQDTQLQGMGSAAVGVVTAHHYHMFLKSKENQGFLKAWKAEYGKNSVPDFVGVGGYDGMAAVYAAIKASNGGRITADGAMKTLRGWKFNSPRGPISIDAETRDIVQNVYISVVRQSGGKLVQEVQQKFDAVKDKCKELKLGKCGKKLY
ncbi:MAG: ABC transporter substrate-binding protein [Rhodospirillales bacterium]|jgi:branched-chain amino acid transport system substrate-binding protein|nr:ABC transporter substrate-binding protein [Rhodospirillales bacterium]MDP6646749.1 ABC transporter substrate-binding protein [Rhodospirillales bacterium]MDP6843515.1 ABC transporter substrate-binding protein [Rhodospirillales bacterium]|tara:strand:+ start:390 stop:1607 length:1218 start_codon:yes stop_codon:yes gene_type:complete